MKIKTKDKSIEEVLNSPNRTYQKPVIQKKFYRSLMRFLSKPELKAINFTYTEEGMDQLSSSQPALYLMNHSSFTDLQIASTLLYDRQYHIVTTNDGFVGKYKLMHKLGCIPTKKFISDPALVKDMKYCIDKLGSSILMFPEASYTFDGTTTALPDSIGKCVKLLGVPVVMIKTKGAFLRDPLYNNLQKRNTNVSACVTYLISSTETKSLTADQINKIIFEAFEYNHFKDQIDNQINIDEPFRADGLERVLYKCSHCNLEGFMIGKGTSIKCEKCGTTHELDSYGKLILKPSNDGTVKNTFESIPDWYNWQRECVKKELIDGTYSCELDVDIKILSDFESIYNVGEGHLSHDNEGWHLSGCNGLIDFTLPVNNSYNLYADYFWYEIGDMISIGDWKRQYYCFPHNKEELLVAKARLATEELYKLKKTVQP